MKRFFAVRLWLIDLVYDTVWKLIDFLEARRKAVHSSWAKAKEA